MLRFGIFRLHLIDLISNQQLHTQLILWINY